MKKLFAFSSLCCFFVGCASYNPATTTPAGDVIYEPAGAENTPRAAGNQNWDLNARNFRQNPYYAPWGVGAPFIPGTDHAVHTSSDLDKNMDHHIAPDYDAPQYQQ